MNIRHPAKYSDSVIDALVDLLDFDGIAFDPFGGVGKIREFGNRIRARLIIGELESEWARSGADIQSDAMKCPFAAETFDAVFTSPTYGNRMADHFTDHKGTDDRRNTYRHAIGRPLSPNNSGALQWGEKYKEFHSLAWIEVFRVLKFGGVFILNISDHIRSGKRIPVSEWHRNEIERIGFVLVDERRVSTPRNRFGANGNVRVEYESIFVFRK